MGATYKNEYTRQYDANWAHVHMFPEQASRAAEELRADALLPGHIGRFSIANHAWDEPFNRIVAASDGKRYRLLTPTVGTPVDLADREQQFPRWWESAEKLPADRVPQPSSTKPATASATE